MEETNQFLEYALMYARLGFKVFPLQEGDKRPLGGTHGCKDASRDEGRIRRWWRQHPTSNIGIATGDGLVVVDVDHEKIPADLDVPDTLSVKTGKGHHMYYSTTEAIRNGTNVGLPGIDIRGDGGYVVAPPSIHPNGTPYTWVWEITLATDEIELTPAPSWVTDRVTQARREPSKQADVGDAYNRPARSGERDDRAVKFAAHLVKTGQTNQKTLADAILAWNRSNEPPMGALLDDPDEQGVKDWAMQKAWSALQLQAGNGGKKLEVVTVGELRTMDVKREWIVEGGVLSEGSKTIVYGEPGCGKTFLGFQLAHAISSGTPFLDHFNVPKSKKVLYLSGENPIEDLQGRILKADADIEGGISNAIVLSDTYDLNLHSPEGMTVLREAIVEHGIEVVILDPLYIFARVDEAKLLDVVAVEIGINNLIKDLHVSFVLLHHTTKDQYNNKGQQFDRGLNELRGAGWAMWAESVIKLTILKDGQSDDKDVPDRQIEFQKVRSGPTGNKYRLHFSENQVFSVKGNVGNRAILDWLKNKAGGKATGLEIQKALAGTAGLSRIARNLKQLKDEGLIAWGGSNKGLVTLK